MRYLTYRRGGEYRLGSLQESYIVDVGHVAGVSDMLELVKQGPEAWKRVASALLEVNPEKLEAEGGAVPYEDALVAAPIQNPPKNVICLGRNYFKHYLEGAVARGEAGDKPPEAPIYFTKPHTAIIGPFDPIPLDPAVTQKLDWEAEMGVIIGVGGKGIARDEAMSYVFGYTVINDVTARDLQNKHQQWFKGKGLDASCPMGPVVVTPDELPEPVHVPISLRVNGVTKQDANTGQLMFDIPTIIEDLSLAITLEPGDIISTGTPDGVGHFMKPPEYLKVGDVMETEVDGIGTLRNRITSLERSALVDYYNHERDTLFALLSRLRPEHFDLPTEDEGWTAKDIVAHIAGAAAWFRMAVQRHLDHHPNPGIPAMHERNQKWVENRKERSFYSLLDEIVREHHKNTEFFLGLEDEQLKVEGPMSSGEMVTVVERFRRAGRHYMEHGAQIARAAGLVDPPPVV